MNEPFSMFDWGMYRLRNHVLSTENKIRKNLKISESDIWPRVEYDFKLNKIYIRFSTRHTTEFLKKVPPIEICKEITRTCRESLGIVTVRDRLIKCIGGIDGFFWHEGSITYRTSNMPNNLREEIEKITVIYVSVSDMDLGKKMIESESPLSDSGVYIKK